MVWLSSLSFYSSQSPALVFYSSYSLLSISGLLAPCLTRWVGLVATRHHKLRMLKATEFHKFSLSVLKQSDGVLPTTTEFHCHLRVLSNMLMLGPTSHEVNPICHSLQD